MKKISVLIIALLLVATSVFANATVQSTDSMSFYGRIGLGDITFGVTESTNNAPGTPIDLLSAAMLPTSEDGVLIGSWTFTGTNQIAKNYKLLYNFGTLNATVAGQNYAIAYVLKEEGSTGFFGSMPLIDLASAQTSYSADAGSPSETREIYARLTNDGRTAALSAAASSNYTSTITVQLIAQ